MLNKHLFFCIIIFTSLGFTLTAKRHSRIKRAQRLEMRKTIIITDDQKLATALAKQTKYMKFDEAVLAKNYYIKERELDMIIKCGQRLLAVGGDQEIMRQTRFELAQVFLEKENFKEAEKYASEYQKFYPGTAQAIEAEYINMRANFLAQLPSDRDQSKTLTTIKLGHEFLERHIQSGDYTKNVHDMLEQSYQTLTRSELQIIETQLKAYNNTSNPGYLDAVIKRLAHVKEKYMPHAPLTKKKVLEVEENIKKIAHPSITPPTLTYAANNTVLDTTQKSDLLTSTESTLEVAHKKKNSRKGFFGTVKDVFVENNEAYFA